MQKRVVTTIRQGDVNLIKVDAIPDGVVEQKPERGLVILEHGEVTGHAHHMQPKVAKKFSLEKEGQLTREFLTIKEDTQLLHTNINTGGVGDHDPVNVPAGDYEKVRAREWTTLGIRQVID